MAAMNVLFSVVVIGLFSNCLAARVGESCASSTCEDLGAYCEPLGQTCECNTGWLQNGKNCSRTSGTECHINMCSDPSNMICSNSLCTCDSSKKLDAGTTNQQYCKCPTGYTYSSDKEMCLSQIGYPCSSVSDCVVTDGIKCSSSKCACDTTYIYSSGSKGSDSCSCDNSKATLDSSSGICKVKVGKSCSTSSTTCVDYASCSSGKCVCDANKHFVTNANGDTCECDSTNGYTLSNGECLLKNNRTCTSDSQCLSYFTCGTEYFDPEQICECSSAKNFAQGTADDTTCACINMSYTAQSTASNGCLLKIDETSCTQNSECISNYCNSTNSKCDCDRSAHKTGNTDKDACICDDGLGYTLDSATSTCMLKNKEDCTSSSECASGYCDTTTTHKCTCDADIYQSESTVAACKCSTGYQRDSSNNCVGKIGYACSIDSNCVSGLVCDSSLCACDSGENYDSPGSTGSTSCNCATGYTLYNGTTCHSNIGETCSSDSNCYPGNGIYCDLTSKQCACNASDYWEKYNDYSCQCMTDYLENNNQCAIIETKACNYTEGSRPCVQGAICDKATKLCKCDGTKNYESGSSGSCNCKTNFVSKYNPDRCVAKVGGPCTASNETNVCVSNSECSAPTTSTTNYTCTCSKTAYWDGSCSGAANLVASMTVLVSALFVASRQ